MLILFFASPFCIVASIFLFFVGKEYLAILFIFVFAVLQIISILGFKFIVSREIKKLNEEHFKLSKKISGVSFKKDHNFIFKKDKNGYVCETFDTNTLFNPTFILFKKYFVVAFVTRALRYPKISNQKPLHYLGKLRLKGFDKNLQINVIFKKDTKERKFCVLKNGVSKCNFIPWAMTYICTPPSYSYRYYHTSSQGRQVMKINERAFQLLQ